jgi:hypothetical protein
MKLFSYRYSTCIFPISGSQKTGKVPYLGNGKPGKDGGEI